MSGQGNFFLTTRRGSELLIRVSGTRRLQAGLPAIQPIDREIDSPPRPKLIRFDAQEVTGWDSSIVWFLAKVSDLCRQRGVAVGAHVKYKGVEIGSINDILLQREQVEVDRIPVIIEIDADKIAEEDLQATY